MNDDSKNKLDHGFFVEGNPGCSICAENEKRLMYLVNAVEALYQKIELIFSDHVLLDERFISLSKVLDEGKEANK